MALDTNMVQRDRGAIELGTIFDFYLQWLEAGASVEEAVEAANSFIDHYPTTNTEKKIAHDIIRRFSKLHTA